MSRKGQRKKEMRFLKQSLRFPAAIILILILIVIMGDKLFLAGEIPELSLQQWLYLGIGMLTLLLLEWIESWIYPRRTGLPLNLIFLAARIYIVVALYEVVVVVFEADATFIMSILSALLVFKAYFYLGFIPLLLFFIVVFVMYFFRLEMYPTRIFFDNFLTVLMVLFAAIIKNDDRVRLRNLELYRELESYAGKTITLAKQDERNRISRELHDSLGHYLTGMNIQLQKAMAYREIDAEESDAAVIKAQKASTDAMRELRQTLSNLREMEDEYDFMQEIQKLVDSASENEFELNYQVNGKPEGFSELGLTTLHRAVQEGLTNVKKHAQAERVELKIDLGRRDAHLDLRDDGVGFSRKLIVEGHYGLHGLEERIELVGGRLQIRSRKGKGTRIRIRIPKRPGGL